MSSDQLLPLAIVVGVGYLIGLAFKRSGAFRAGALGCLGVAFVIVAVLLGLLLIFAFVGR